MTSNVRPHVLVLAENTLARDTRILKQIGSLVKAGYRVSALAVTDDESTGHDCADPDRHIYRFAMDDRAAFADPMATPTGAALFAGTVGDLMAEAARGQADYRSLRRAIDLLRIPAALHWSAKRRAEGRRRLKALRLRVRDLLFQSLDGPTRLDLAARYEAAARAFCETSSAWQARLAELGPPQIVHAHDLRTLGAGAVLAERHGAQLIYDAHEYEPERTPPLPAAERRVIETFEDRALGESGSVVTVSESIVGLYRRRLPDREITLVQNAPDLRLFGSNVAGLRKRTGVAPDAPLAVFVGLPQLGMRGMQVTLEAMAQVPELALAVIGPRWKAVDAELMAAVHTDGMADRVHLLDPVAPNDVVPVIRDADLSFCLIQDVTLSYRYSMPNKLFEAVLAGVPTVVSDFPDMGGFIRKHCAGLVVDQTDPDAVAEAVRTILSDRAAFVPSGEARTRLEAVASWQGQESMLLDLYERVLDGADRTDS